MDKFNPPSRFLIRLQVKNALNEDLLQLDKKNDISGYLLKDEPDVKANLYCGAAGILCGIAWFEESFWLLDSKVEINWLKDEGDRLQGGNKLCVLTGSPDSLLAAERTALNFLQILSATATQSASLAGTNLHIMDTRKTIPGIRVAQKYAVRVGGCHNHRFGLYDAFLIKENHIAAAGTIQKTISLLQKAVQDNPDKPIIIEVETMEQLKYLLKQNIIRINVIMLDNWGLAQIKEAVKLRTEYMKSAVQFEVSGGVDEIMLAKLRKLGIKRVSMGKITKDCKAVDFSLRFV